MKNLIPALLIPLMNLVPAVLFQQKFGKTLPLTMIITAMFMMLSQFVFHTFRVTYYLSAIIAIAGIVITVFYKDRKKNLKLILSSGFIAYVLLVLLLIWADTNHVLSVWDELQHWGKMVKEMIRLDDFYNSPLSTLPTNLDYPPFISCFELFWVTLAGGYTEMNLAVGLHVFLLTLVITPILDEKKGNDAILAKVLKPVIYSSAIVLFLMLCDINHALFTTYTDIFIACMFIYALFFVYTQEAMKTSFGFFGFMIALTGLVSSKQICIVFAAVCIAAYILVTLLFIPTWKKKGIALAKLAAACILPAVFYFIWTARVNALGIEPTIGPDDPVTLGDLIGLLQGKGEEFRIEITERVVKVARTEQYMNTPFTVTPLTVMIAGDIALLIHGILFRKDNGLWKDLLFIGGLTLFGFIYLLAMVYVYAYCFEGTENSFGSLIRYNSTYTIFILLFVFLVYLRSLLEFKDGRKFALPLIPIVLCFALCPSLLSLELPDRSGKNPNQRYKDVADYIMANVEKGSGVCIVFTSPYVNDYQMKVNYYLDDGVYVRPNSRNIMDVDFTDNTELVEDMGSRFASAEYVYIEDATGTFNWNCREYVENEEYIRGALYKVTPEPLHLSLVGVNENNPEAQFWLDE